MADTHKGTITLIAGEALEPYRRVKYHSSAGQVVYADAADGDGWIGVTLPGITADNTASGSPVTIELRGECKTLKMYCAAAVTANASIYPEADGAVSDDAGTVVIGTAAGTGTGSAAGAIVEVHPNGGSGSVMNASNVAAWTTTAGDAPLIVIRKTSITASGDTTIGRTARAIQIVAAWVIQLGTTETDVVLKNGTTAFSTAISAGTGAGVKTEITTFTAASLDLTASADLKANLATADATGVEIVVLAVPL